MRPTPPKKPGAPGRHPLGPPLDFDGLRAFHRRLHARPLAEQVAFLRRLNWNMLDDSNSRPFVSWLGRLLNGPDADARQAALDALAAWPRAKRARWRELLLSTVTDAENSRELARMFGGAPKRQPPTPESPEPARAADAADLAKLAAFFKKP